MKVTDSLVPRTSALVMLCALAALMPNAQAQVAEPAVPPPESISPPPSEIAPLEDEKIEQFADAYLAIEQIHAQAAMELKETRDAASADKIKANAETQIIEAVEQSGLRLDEFNQIADLLKVDAQLRQRVAERVKQRRGA